MFLWVFFEKVQFLSKNCIDYFWANFGKKIGFILLQYLVTLFPTQFLLTKWQYYI